MNKDQQMASAILKHVGGKENVDNLTNCMTRVRIRAKDDTAVDKEGLKKIDGVMGVVEDDTWQIVVGPGTVNVVTAEIQKLIGEDNELSFEEKKCQGCCSSKRTK